MNRIIQLKTTVVFLFMCLALNTYTFAQSVKQTDKYLYGVAAIYEDGFEGKVVASGGLYSPDNLTAGHRSLPFGTRVEVENLSNGKKAQVIINDRGPFEKNRVLNMSKKAAEILDFVADGSTFVKITILELGTSLPSPLGLPTPPIGQDIPQQQDIETPIADNTFADMTPPATTEKGEFDDFAFLDDEGLFEDLEDSNLFADLGEEADFMDDTELTNEESQLKAQSIPNAVDNAPNVAPISGFEPTEDILINDPLSNITIAPSDEFIADPNPISDPSPFALTDEEEQLLEENAGNDPFADLFNDTSEPFSFQDEVSRSMDNSPVIDNTVGNHIDDSKQYGAEPIRQPVEETNLVTMTNFVTNVVSVTNTEYSDGMEDSSFDDFYYDDITEAPQPTQESTTPAEPTTPAPLPTSPTTPNTPEPLEFQKLGNHYILQLGAFSKQKNAMNLYESLRKSGFNAYITDVKVKGQNLMRVRVGYFKTLDEAVQVSTQLKENYNLDNRVIQIDYDEEK